LQASLHLEAVASEQRLRDDEFAFGLEVVVQPVVGREVRIARPVAAARSTAAATATRRPAACLTPQVVRRGVWRRTIRKIGRGAVGRPRKIRSERLHVHAAARPFLGTDKERSCELGETALLTGHLLRVTEVLRAFGTAVVLQIGGKQLVVLDERILVLDDLVRQILEIILTAALRALPELIERLCVAGESSAEAGLRIAVDQVDHAHDCGIGGCSVALSLRARGRRSAENIGFQCVVGLQRRIVGLLHGRPAKRGHDACCRIVGQCAFVGLVLGKGRIAAQIEIDLCLFLQRLSVRLLGALAVNGGNDIREHRLRKAGSIIGNSNRTEAIRHIGQQHIRCRDDILVILDGSRADGRRSDGGGNRIVQPGHIANNAVAVDGDGTGAELEDGFAATCVSQLQRAAADGVERARNDRVIERGDIVENLRACGAVAHVRAERLGIAGALVLCRLPKRWIDRPRRARPDRAVQSAQVALNLAGAGALADVGAQGGSCSGYVLIGLLRAAAGHDAHRAGDDRAEEIHRIVENLSSGRAIGERAAQRGGRLAAAAIGAAPVGIADHCERVGYGRVIDSDDRGRHAGGAGAVRQRGVQRDKCRPKVSVILCRRARDRGEHELAAVVPVARDCKIIAR
jgi:hypothetical protein